MAQPLFVPTGEPDGAGGSGASTWAAAETEIACSSNRVVSGKVVNSSSLADECLCRVSNRWGLRTNLVSVTWWAAVVGTSDARDGGSDGEIMVPGATVELGQSNEVTFRKEAEQRDECSPAS